VERWVIHFGTWVDGHRLADPVPAPKLTYRPATAHGWLRRTDLDRPGIYVWERPDGSLHGERSRHVPTIVTADFG
jgi:hypothetical protein